MTREFIYMPEFEKQWKKCKLSDSAQRDLEAFLCEFPASGALIQGTGGLRKLRWALPGKGKSGSIRILYVDFNSFEKIFFITCFLKGIKISLSQEEKRKIKLLIGSIKSSLRRTI
jgi:mRNA-degrading endonuclease RelE of RelBE toxin-antitoxin system